MLGNDLAKPKGSGMAGQSSPQINALRARAAAHTKWAKTPDRLAATAAARKAWLDRFYDETPADLPDDVRLRMAESARSAYYAKLALRSVMVRRARRDAKLAAEPVADTAKPKKSAARQKRSPQSAAVPPPAKPVDDRDVDAALGSFVGDEAA